jgi:hypothetical protein
MRTKATRWLDTRRACHHDRLAAPYNYYRFSVRLMREFTLKISCARSAVMLIFFSCDSSFTFFHSAERSRPVTDVMRGEGAKWNYGWEDGCV